MGRLAIRVRPRDPSEVEADLRAQDPAPETGHDPEEATERGSTGFVLDVKAAGTTDPKGKYDAAILAIVSVVSFVAAFAAASYNHLEPAAWLASVSGGCLIHLLFGRPVFRLARALSAESQRLRAALTCPYCHDQLDDEALVCDRDGCGAYYHEECWNECRRDYGGCAIYGCGTATAHAVGRFALQRRVWRLLVAAALFPPKLVKRLRESERQSFREVWERSRAYQSEISNDAGRTLVVGFFNATLSIAAALTFLSVFDVRTNQGLLSIGLLFVLLVPCVILFMRVPLAGHLTWAGSRLIARIFRDELAALSRADEGTFLARLSAGLGKKD